jgi:hypothetical protein
VLWTLSVMLIGCLSASQTGKNVPAPAGPATGAKIIPKTAFSGIPVMLDSYAELNPDCSSLGLENVIITKAPSHGSVAILNGVEAYTNFPANNQRYECNRKTSPSVGIQYTSAKAFTGIDSFTLHRVSHSGNLLVYEYVIAVEKPYNAAPGAAPP